MRRLDGPDRASPAVPHAAAAERAAGRVRHRHVRELLLLLWVWQPPLGHCDACISPFSCPLSVKLPSTCMRCLHAFYRLNVLLWIVRSLIGPICWWLFCTSSGVTCCNAHGPGINGACARIQSQCAGSEGRPPGQKSLAAGQLQGVGTVSTTRLPPGRPQGGLLIAPSLLPSRALRDGRLLP